MLKLVPWDVFDRLVELHGADELTRTFKTRHQLVALLYGQFSGAPSLRGIVDTLSTHAARLYHVGGRVPRRSTLADANRLRSPQVFSGLFAHMLGMASRSFRRRAGDMVLLVDSTGLHLAGQGSDWARFSADVCGAKAHVVYDPDFAGPVYHAITPAKVNDITAAKAMPITAGATYVFDLGYYDYGWWAELDAAGCRIVTRFKTNTPLRNARTMPLAPDANVLSDRVGVLPGRQARSRQNPMAGTVREVVVTTETGKRLRLLTNDLDASAQEISDLYKRRWQIELFFRFVKQNLQIRRFYGRSENAVRIQIAVALIAMLILHLLRTTTKVQHGMQELARLVRANLMHRKDLTRLRQIQQPPPMDYRQMAFDWAYT